MAAPTHNVPNIGPEAPIVPVDLPTLNSPVRVTLGDDASSQPQTSWPAGVENEPAASHELNHAA